MRVRRRRPLLWSFWPQRGGGAHEEDVGETDIQANEATDLAAANARIADLLALINRDRADFVNHRRRVEEGREHDANAASARVIARILPVLDDLSRAASTRPTVAPDSLERALAAHFGTWLPAGEWQTRDWVRDAWTVQALIDAEGGDAVVPWQEGLLTIIRKLEAVLAVEGLEVIEVEPGVQFDPHEHEALDAVTDSVLPDGAVVEMTRKGYRLAGDVLRPALVRVATDPAGLVAPRRQRGRQGRRSPAPRRS